MKYRASIYTLALLGALALAAVSGGLLTPSGNVTYAQTANTPPEFPSSSTGNREVPENTPPGTNIGKPVTATDLDDDTLVYSLEEGTDNDSFNIDPDTGQLITKDPLDHEGTRPSYSVAVVATQVSDADMPPSATQTVTITVNDVDELPSAPAAPTVTSNPDDNEDLDVNWDAPDNKGPTITDYDYRYKKTTEHTWAEGPDSTSTGTDATIERLTAGASYQVQVRAKSPEGTSPWSLSGIGATNNETNAAPTFSSATEMRRVDENTPPRQPVDLPLTATDTDSNMLTYSLAGADADLFDVVETTGQILTKAPLNREAECNNPGQDHEANCNYYVMVKVDDGDGGSGAASVKITVENLDEPPSRPAAPTVMAGEDMDDPDPDQEPESDHDESTTTLDVTWAAPNNMGPSIKRYKVEYRKGTTGAFSPLSPDPTDTSATIEALDTGSSYQVRVRAQNGEADTTENWSPVGTGSTNPANNPPQFSSATVTRSVPENTAAERNVGTPVTATDADNDPLTYELGGTDVGSFEIDESTGQIKTIEGVTYDHEAPKSTYSVTVTAKDGRHLGTDETPVTINVADVDEPPTPPAAPTVTTAEDDADTLDQDESTTRLNVNWKKPDTTGRSDVTGYEVQYRVSGRGGFTNVTDTIDMTTADSPSVTITGLVAQTSYNVQVRAKSDEGISRWSSLGTGSTNTANNVPPEFLNAPVMLTVDEKTSAGQNVGTGPVVATDNDSTMLSYSLEGPDADSFDIESTSGQIKTKDPLNYEARASYSVIVKVVEEDHGSATASVTITVDDVDSEKPGKPAIPTVTPAAEGDPTTTLDVSWTEPDNPGPDITGYTVEYRAGNTGDFTNLNHSGTETTAKIVDLEDGTLYEVRVNAMSDEGTSQWSETGTGSTNRANKRPTFSSGTSATLNVVENTRSGVNVGAPIPAIDLDGDNLTYELVGVHADLFGFNSRTAQITVKSPLDHEDRDSYSLTVKVDDGADAPNSAAAISVTVMVTDVDEPPAAPAAPSVVVKSTTSIEVSWETPGNMGPPIIDYDIQYNEGGGSFRAWPHDGMDMSAIISGLNQSTRYQVQVRARNEEGAGPWSPSSAPVTPNADAPNNAPRFVSTAPTITVAEDTAAGTDIGSPLQTRDPDNDTLTFTLEGTDAAPFAIDATGQISVGAALNYEAQASHSFTAKVEDGRGGSDTIGVTVTVTDVDGEAPLTPSIPTVTETPNSDTSLEVSWTAPSNPGPPITDYDVQYREGSSGNFLPVTHDGTARTATITGLTTGDTYEVQVRATNADGTGPWSNSGMGMPGVNNPPTFSSTSATRSVDENTAAATDIGSPISATDANAGDTLTYSLSGPDAASFDIVRDTGQLRTKAALDYETDFRYSVTVTVSDGELTNTISVTINVVDMHPSCASAIGNGASPGLANDCEALLDSKETLQGTTGSLNWATFTPIAQWDGVYLSGRPQRVTRLNLRSLGLVGTLPADLNSLTMLTRLWLHNNSLAGEIPDLSGLRNLESLWLSGSNMNLSGDISRLGLGSKTRLDTVSLWGNSLTGSIPDLSRLRSLVRLKLQSNSLSGGIPATLGSLSSLRDLRLRNNQLGGSIPPQLNNIASLQILALENTGLTGSIPDLSGLTRLRTLNVRDNNLTGGIPAWLGGMDNMVILNLHTNQLTGSIPTQLGNVSNLERLYLHGNGLTDEVPAQLGSLSSLTNFWIKNNMLSGELPPSLNMLTNLERVRISGNNFTGCVPAALDLEDDPATTVVESDDIALTDPLMTVCSNGN